MGIGLPDLAESLQNFDLGHLLIIARLWGIEFTAPDVKVGRERLVPLLLKRELVEEVISALPEISQKALWEVQIQGGRMSWSLFCRNYGEVREMGAARRDREKPYLNENATPSESLWYRGLINRAFFELEECIEEYAYIPKDLYSLLPKPPKPEEKPLGRPALPSEQVVKLVATDTILDDACTILAAIRNEIPIESIQPLLITATKTPYALSPESLRILLQAANLLDDQGQPLLEPVQEFLSMPRGEALVTLVKSWMNSQVFNELHLLPGIRPEGEWRNDPLQTRHKVLEFLKTILGGVPLEGENSVYWSLSAFIADIKYRHPDFQRPAGDYDSWFIRDVASGDFLRGFENWERVDGELIRFMIGGILHWLGILDIAFPSSPVEAEAATITAFRYSRMAGKLLALLPASGLSAEDEKITLRSDGRIRIPLGASRVARYQIARFCSWDGFKDGFYRYQLTPSSLQRAKKQGLRVAHLITLLRTYSTGIPPNLIKALQLWESEGTQAIVGKLVVLRVKDEQTIKRLKNSPANRYLGDSLGPNSIAIKPGAGEKVIAALFEMGILGEIVEDLQINEKRFLKKPPE